MQKSPGHRAHPEHAVRERHTDLLLRVEVSGQRVAESRDVIVVSEDGHPERYYFLRENVDMSKLHRTATTSRSVFKGEANYYTVRAGGTTLEDAAWTYEDPYQEHRALKDRIAFYDDKFSELAVTALA